jgi:hypothetical protein
MGAKMESIFVCKAKEDCVDGYFQARDDLNLSTSILLPKLKKTFWHATKSDVPRLEGFQIIGP